MLLPLLFLLICQLIGEFLARASQAPLPGPVIGMLLLLAAMIALPRLATTMRPLAQGILGNLSLLFVPAGVGVVGHIATLGNQSFAILLALLVSTVLAIAVGALSFALTARLLGQKVQNQDD
jgi:holin-like protein